MNHWQKCVKNKIITWEVLLTKKNILLQNKSFSLNNKFTELCDICNPMKPKLFFSFFNFRLINCRLDTQLIQILIKNINRKELWSSFTTMQFNYLLFISGPKKLLSTNFFVGKNRWLCLTPIISVIIYR